VQESISRFSGRIRGTAARLVPVLVLAAAARAPQPTPPPVTGFGVIQGTVLDSIHRVPLGGAALVIDRVGRMGFTGADGRYTIDSLPPGSYRVHLSHPLLDTIGLVISTQPLVVRPSEAVTLDLGIPSSEHIVSVLCPGPMLARGPGALIGQVVDPETDRPAIGIEGPIRI
jgi:hypothetical protein